MKRILFYPFTPTNPTTKTLVRQLQDYYRIEAERVVDYGFILRSDDVGIGWGVCRITPQPRTFINKADFTRNAANKIRTFEYCSQSNVKTVDWTTSRETASRWLSDGSIIFERHEIYSQEGAGIRIVKPLRHSELEYAPLYTKFFPQEREFRVHVWDGQFLCGSEKLLRSGTQPTWEQRMVRNHQSRLHSEGVWIFCSISESIIPDGVVRESIKAVKALGMNFGAVDIGWNQEEGAKLFEVNSAPGIEGPTLTAYCNKIAEIARA